MSTKSITKQRAKAKEKLDKHILSNILRMDNAQVMTAKKAFALKANELKALYCKFHGDKIGKEVFEADVKRICGIKGDL